MSLMKSYFALFLACVTLGAGCAKTKPDAAKPAVVEVREEPIIRPVTRPIGRISTVSLVSRFVVITYPSSNLPKTGQQLGVYREGRKVGQAKVTGPERDTITAADLVDGEAQAGDEVREN